MKHKECEENGECDQRSIHFLRFIVHMLDNTHMFVQPHVADMIRSKISEFRDQNTYEKPA
ncbi:hypothetical protein HPP92_014763 [Vanilla planifolia]|uniref:General transcription and DNA repair factor IIH subunit TFB5 n=1 Tax=Vanilla planifolia TaxID=51239 RepID=A0A835QL19_VANPL|nr:hypothetical protein HPP92_014763 [Vanilla planifolia]